jgi:hypothetical protein
VNLGAHNLHVHNLLLQAIYKSIACLLLFALSDAFGAVIHLIILKKDE